MKCPACNTAVEYGAFRCGRCGFMLHLSYAAHSASVSILTQGDAPSMVAYSSPDSEHGGELLPAARVVSLADSRSLAADGSMVAQVDAQHAVLYRPAAGKSDEYQLLSVIGQGGMGVVFKALQKTSGRVVAIKRPLFARGTRRHAVADLMREWNSTRSVTHPNVVRSLGADIDREGPFLVSEYIDGRDLRRVLVEDGPIQPEVMGRVAMAVCHAVGRAHTTGLIHRDLKPSNIVVDERGLPFVLDFGLARGMMEIRTHEAGRFLGTPGYTPPEQAINASKADHRADFYALGVTFYHLLTGLPDKTKPPPPLPLPWLLVLSRAASPNPHARHLNAAELMRDLRGAFEPEAGRCICCREPLAEDPTCRACGTDQNFPCPNCGQPTRLDQPTCGHCRVNLGDAARHAGAQAYLGALLQAGERHAAVCIYEIVLEQMGSHAAAFRAAWDPTIRQAEKLARQADGIAQSVAWSGGPVEALMRLHQASKHDASYRDAYMDYLAEVNPAAYAQQFEAPLTPEQVRAAEASGDEITLARHAREREAAANLATAAGTSVSNHEVASAAASHARVKARWRRNRLIFIAVALLLFLGYMGFSLLLAHFDNKPSKRKTQSAPRYR